MMMGSSKLLCILLFISLFSEFMAVFSRLQPPDQNNNLSLHFHDGAEEIPEDSKITPGVQLHIQKDHVVMDNGILQVTFSNPAGGITGIQYKGLDNVLEIEEGESRRGYWDIVWKGEDSEFDSIDGTNFKVIVESPEKVELSFTSMWNPSPEAEGKAVPLNFDKRFIMLRGSSGFYTYAIYEHLKEWPAFDISNTRTVFKLRKDKFHYMAISDGRQRYMPLPDDRLPGRGQALDYPEAVLLTNPIEPEFKGEVDDKYEYSCNNIDNQVHGWISTNPPVGFWLITPSSEFNAGGPLKQSLTSHVGPTTLAVYHSTHYAGADMMMSFGANEPWKKVLGPIFLHLNSPSNGNDPLSLWQDAKTQMTKEVQSWPYDFLASKDFPPASRRGSIHGRLLVLDGMAKKFAGGAYVGLASPGEAGSWQLESKGYQYWTTANNDGSFTINNIREGLYNLYAWVPGFIGDYKYQTAITITAGSNINIGDIVYEPPRNGPTLWEIGYPDRSAAEFFVPDTNSNYINKLYVKQDRFRQYGIWERYSELYPRGDLVYTVGTSDYKKDWFYAQVTRKQGNTYVGTTWQIQFMLDQADQKGTYKLHLALASANGAKLEVRINNASSSPLFSTGLIGRDNTIARHGIHGVYRLYSVDLPGAQVVKGTNTIFLTQAMVSSPFFAVMYDYIRFEGPPSSKAIKNM